MPMPQPKKNEKQNDYMGRCMDFLSKEERTERPQKQKVAICLNTYRGPQKKAKAEIELDINNQETIDIQFKTDKTKVIELDITETEAYQKTYKGKKRSELKDSDFLFPETRSFPIVSPQDVRDAISNFGRMKSNMTYDAFIKKLYQKAKSKGADFVAAIPESTKKEHNLS
jgi:hypothetical protein